MKFLGINTNDLLMALLCLSSITAASPISDTASTSAYGGGKCSNPPVRKEWRSLTNYEKKQYIKAVKCLANKKAIKAVPGAVSRYDDFQGIHSLQTPAIHFVGHFLPWHRYYVAQYEKALREECGWTGGQPYWDWLLDTKTALPMEKWPVFDPNTGFGGNGPFIEVDPSENLFGIVGRTGGGCVKDGPFTYDKFKLSLGPTTNVNLTNIHCLTRDFAEPIARFNLVPSVINELMSKKDFGAFARRMEGEPSFDVTNIHGGGHFGVGGLLGSIGDAYNSPGDPIFWLHHGNLDRVWWQWQQKDPRRLKDVSGPILPFDYANALAGNVTLDFEIGLGKLGKTVLVKQLLDTTDDTLCYTYDK